MLHNKYNTITSSCLLLSRLIKSDDKISLELDSSSSDSDDIIPCFPNLRPIIKDTIQCNIRESNTSRRECMIHIFNINTRTYFSSSVIDLVLLT